MKYRLYNETNIIITWLRAFKMFRKEMMQIIDNGIYDDDTITVTLTLIPKIKK